MERGDTLVILYLKLQLIAMKNEGVIVYTALEPSFEEELALELDEDADTVRTLLAYLQNVGLAERKEEKQFFFPYAVENTGSETGNARRVRRHRERKRSEMLHCNSADEQCNSRSAQCNTEIEKEKDIEKELEKEGEKSKKVDYELIARMYNDTCVSFPRLTTLSDARKKAIKARLNKYSIEDIKRAFEIAESSDFLKGNNGRNWSANFDWIIKDSNIAKILDGNYNNKKISPNYNNSTAQELDEFYNMASSWAESEGV